MQPLGDQEHVKLVQGKLSDYYEWTGSDYDAIMFLKLKGIEEVDGVGLLSPPYWPFTEDAKTSAAIDYLCYEWDYCYGERKHKGE